jgi:hypothetical protein
MTIKVNGGIKKGYWGERKVDYVTVTFGSTILAPSVDVEGVPTVGQSAFSKPDTALDVVVQKLVQQKAIVLAVGDVYATGTKVDLMLAHAQGWESDVNGLIASGTVNGKVYDADGKAIGAADFTYSISYAKFQALAAAVTADLVEFPAGSGKYFTKDE